MIFEHQDGFEIARQDLLIRGPGEFLGTQQSGVPMLRFANLEEDSELLILARDFAPIMLKTSPNMAQLHIDYWLHDKQAFLSV